MNEKKIIDFDERMLLHLSKNEFPDVVEEKWLDCENIVKVEPMRKKKKNFILLKSAGAVAACFIILLGIGFVNPNFAEAVPFVGSIIDMIRKSGFYTDDAVFYSAIGEYTEKQETDLNLGGIEDVYCDGKILAFGVSIPQGDIKSTTDSIDVETELTINGKKINNQFSNNNKFLILDTDRYINEFLFNVCTEDLSGDLDIELTINNIDTVDYKTMILNQDPESLNYLVYEPKIERIENLSLTYTAKGTVNSDLVKIYEINKEENGVSFNSMTLTPAYIDFDIEDNSGLTLVYEVEDDLGNKLDGLETGLGYADSMPHYWQTALKDARKITINLYDKREIGKLVASAEVPIDCGYLDKYMDKVYLQYDESEITYIPALSTYEYADHIEENVNKMFPLSHKYELGDVINTEYMLMEGSLDVTYSNLQVFDNFYDSDVDFAELRQVGQNGSAEEKYQRFIDEGYKFLTVDVNIKANGAKSYFEYEEDPSKTEFWINDFASVAFEFKNGEWYAEAAIPETGLGINEPDYFSAHGTGYSDFWHFRIEPDEENTYTVGFFIDDEIIQSSTLRFMCRSNDEFWIPGDSLTIYNWVEIDIK